MNKSTNEIKNRIIQGGRRSNRTVFFATKVTPEFDAILRQQAHAESYSLAEMLEIYQEAFINWKKGQEAEKENLAK